MRNGFRIGRLSGINIYIDWSWLLIFVLVTWNLATSFTQVHPAWGTALTWGVAIVAALLFFASVLAHELAHSLVAQRQGIPVRSISLFLFGGVANIQQEPKSPRDEFLLAIVGPLISLVLGVLFLLAAGAAGELPANAATDPSAALAGLDPVTTILLWLGPINILLGLFNLLPGFPLDGGRVLRAILWAATNNLQQATRWASWVGQAVAWLMIVAGVAIIFGVTLPFLGGGFVDGLWLVLIGWFLGSAAIQSYRQVVVHDLLEGVPASRLMRANVPTVPQTITLSELVHGYVMGTDERAFPVMEGDRLVGLVTLEDLRKVAREEWETTRVAAVMTPADQLTSVTPQTDAAEALDKLLQRDVRQVPVVNEGRLVGMVRRRDFMTWLQLQSHPQVLSES